MSGARTRRFLDPFGLTIGRGSGANLTNAWDPAGIIMKSPSPSVASDVTPVTPVHPITPVTPVTPSTTTSTSSLAQAIPVPPPRGEAAARVGYGQLANQQRRTGRMQTILAPRGSLEDEIKSLLGG